MKTLKNLAKVVLSKIVDELNQKIENVMPKYSPSPELNEEIEDAPVIMTASDLMEAFQNRQANIGIIPAQALFEELSSEALHVEKVAYKYAGKLADAMGLKQILVPTIAVLPAYFVYGGLDDEPTSATVVWQPDGNPHMIHIAGGRIEGVRIQHPLVDDEDAFQYFEAGTSEWERCVAIDLATQLAHVLHEDGKANNAMWHVCKKQALRVGFAAVEKVFGPAPNELRPANMDEPELN